MASSTLEYVIKHSRKVSEDKYVSTRVGAIIKKDDRLLLKLDYLPPADAWLNVWPHDPDYKKD